MNYQYMPEEIIVNILSRLPIKSLFRFKCVSKPWLNLISDMCPRQRVAVQNPKPRRGPFQVHHLLGCCNGLLLVRVGWKYFLWNPTTKHCKSIFTDVNRDHGRDNAYGLCYNSSKDNYVAVVVHHDILEQVDSAFVFSVKDKTWNVAKLKDCYRIYSERSGIICNGRLHWLVTSQTGGRRMILCFDPLREEEEYGGFTELDPPTVGEESSIEGCGVLWESILSVCVTDWEKGHVKVMAMLDQNSWSTMFVVPSDGLIEHLIDTVTPLCLSKEGELIMLVGRSQLLRYCQYHMRVVAYCPRKRSCRVISPVMGAMTFMETRVASSQSLSNADKDCFIDTKIHNYVSLHSDYPIVKVVRSRKI